jgi:hypothetical protein
MLLAVFFHLVRGEVAKVPSGLVLSGISQAHQTAGFSTPTTDAQVRLVF